MYNILYNLFSFINFYLILLFIYVITIAIYVCNIKVRRTPYFLIIIEDFNYFFKSIIFEIPSKIVSTSNDISKY